MMSKYGELEEEDLGDDIVGVRYVKELTSAVFDGVHNRIIQGLVDCPECGTTLNKNYIRDTWECGGCGTKWTSIDLLSAIEMSNPVIKEETDE